MTNFEDDDGIVITRPKTKNKIKKPSMYKVIFLNDDYTPMDFVTYVLQEFFRKTKQEAENIMMEVHKKGKAIAGVYTYEIAETKIIQVETVAKENGYPLKLEMEKE